MLHIILADEDLLTTLGRIAALVLVIYVFLFAVLFFVVSLLLLYGNAWIREKTVLMHQLRSILESIDTALHSPKSEVLPATVEPDDRIGQVIQALHIAQSVQIVERAQSTQKLVENVGQRVEPVADRIAEGVIEIRSRTVMAQGMLRAFFLPGSIKPKPRGPLLLPEAIETDASVAAKVPAGSSSLPGVTSNVVITQVNPPAEVSHPTAMTDPGHRESEGTVRNNNAPGH